MSNLEKDIMRKLHIRKKARENMGLFPQFTDEPMTAQFGVEQIEQEELARLNSLLAKNLAEADRFRTQTGYWEINSTRKVLGKLIVLSKKCTRKLLKVFMGWYVFPIYQQQSYFNGKILNATDLLRAITTQKSQLIKQQQEQMNNMSNILMGTNAFNAKLIAEQQEQIQQLRNELTETTMKSSQLIAELTQKMSYLLSKHNLPDDLSLMQNVSPIDYFDFENHFRGSRAGIKELQRCYVDYFKINGGGEILDIGCGRGEFLELMFDYGLAARGIDLYLPFVSYCRNRGFLVEQADALTYLNGLSNTTLGGIFMSQVVEHLDSDYLRALIETAYRKLKPGCYLILETPNPDCVAAITEFNIDHSHVKPVHYKSLEYFFIKAGYAKVERYHKPECLYPLQMIKLIGSHAQNEDEFNEGISNANNMLFGFRDYTLIAMK